MKLSRRQKLFFALTPFAAMVVLCSHIYVLGNTPILSESTDSALTLLVADIKQDGTPEEIGRECFASSERDSVTFVDSYQNPTTTQLFQLWQFQITPHHTSLIVNGVYGIGGEYGIACLHGYDERYDDHIRQHLNEDDARQVALMIWRHTANTVGGVQTLQQNFDEGAVELEQYGEIGYMTAEDMWALQQLGVRIPTIYEIYDPENPPEIRETERGQV